MEKQGMRDLLIEEIESELGKDAGDIDPDCIDHRIDELCALEGISPPKLDHESLETAARTIRARAAWRRRNTQTKEARKRRFIRRAIRGAVAVCCASMVLLSVNFVTTLLTGSCLPSKAGVKICCGTKICFCETAEAEEIGRNN